jgi:hypothetical protein
MTFTYTPISTDKDRVRFHTADTTSATAQMSDEDITAILSENGGDWQKAVIAGLIYIITKLAQIPQVTEDWLSVNVSGQIATYQDVLRKKRREFGISELTAVVVHVYRPDSRMSAPPDFTELQNGQFDQVEDITLYPRW